MIGNMLSVTDLEQALASYERARVIHERLAREHPTVLQFQRSLAASYTTLAAYQRSTGHPDQALATRGRELAIRERLAREHPEWLDYTSDLAATLNNIATVDLDQKRYPEARAKLERAVGLQRKALTANPKHPYYRMFLVHSLENLIRVARSPGNWTTPARPRRPSARSTSSGPRTRGSSPSTRA